MAIQLPNNGPGTVVDTTTLSGKDREIVNIGGNTVAAEVAGVKNTSPAETLYGLVTRPIARVDGETLSTTPLGISGVFTQTGQARNDDGIILVAATARADEASAASGFVIEEYPLADDFVTANLVRVVASASVSADTTTRIYGVIRERKWRVKYTNGATGQATFTLAAAAQPFAPAVDVAGQLIVTDGGTALLVDGSAVTQPISAASLPLPTGAATLGAQLPDGHAVTVDNTVGAPANVQLSDGTDTASIDAAGGLVVKAEGSSVDSNNSSAATLGVSGVFTGTLTDVTQYGSVSVQVFADQDSATDGLSFEWSTDGGSNWDVQDQHDITANQAEQFIIPRVAESFRIVYTNGTTGQGAFRLETILNPWPVSGEVEELDVMLDSKDLALTTRSVIAGETPGGAFVNVQVSTAGNFKVDIEELAGVAISLNTGTRDAGTQRVTIATDDLVPISAASLPLPSGAATSAGQLADDHNVTVSNASLVVTATALDIRALTSSDIVAVLGSTAADAASPNPVVVGFVASATEPAEMSADGDTVKAWADRFGRLVVVKNFPSDVSAAAHGPVTITKTTTAIEDVIAAPAAGQALYITGLSCSNTSATAVRIDISDGSTIRDSMFLAADGGGYVKQFDPPWELTAATALRATASAAVTDIRINAHFYTMDDSSA